MAVYFEVIVCAGFDEAAADRVCEALASAPGIHPDFVTKRAMGPTDDDAGSPWWIAIVPKGLGHAVPADAGNFIAEPAARIQRVECIYNLLRGLPPFVFACAGQEISEQFADSEADELSVIDSITLPTQFLSRPGIVIPAGWLSTVASPARFEAFRPGQLWDPHVAELVTSR